ncbi:MAG: hypothetical protein JO325_08315, partial [Solirubrobacterales bacterium]|nr:hypothetical protein [Solirubrobacterales bacterium]
TDRPAVPRAHNQQIDLLAEAGELFARRSVADLAVEVIYAAAPGQVLPRELLRDVRPAVLDRLAETGMAQGRDRDCAPSVFERLDRVVASDPAADPAPMTRADDEQVVVFPRATAIASRPP